jgi:N-succinyldiaminopimelate aminotransferase
MNPDLERLQPYPFAKLERLFGSVTPNPQLQAITLGLGEPQHPAPEFVMKALREKLGLLAKYPTVRGLPELRTTISNWLCRRFSLAAVDPEQQVLPVTGTREALFAFAQAVVDRSRSPLVLCPNPFYQIYEGAGILAGAELGFLNCVSNNGFIPDFASVSADTWQRCQLLYLCTPGNPTGAVLPLATLVQLIELAREHDFIIASDECYSEIYADESAPPPGLLQACALQGNHEYRNCVVFHSLSKRSNLPGLRSGFVAGDARVLHRFMLYRTYHGCAMPVQHQWASISAWSDENHVRLNRDLYRQKFDAVLAELDGCLEVTRPPAGFYLWPRTPIADTDFARDLYAQQHLTTLPGSFLARGAGSDNPGENYLRLALVAEPAQCREAAQRLHHFSAQL